MVVDYKTGGVNVSHWFSHRPQEPQMLLYALSNAKNLAAVVYGQLRSGKQGYVGLAHAEGIMPSLELLESGRYHQELLDWPDLLADWSRVVGDLASQYCRGDATVDPLPNGCDWCELSMLCRVDELRNRQSAALLEEEV